MRESYRAAYLARSRMPVFRRRVREARDAIREFISRCERPYAAFSGGKDSLAMLILLSRMGYTDVPVFTQADDLDWPDKEEFCRETVRRLGFTDYSYEFSEVSAIDQLVEGRGEVSGTFSHVVRRYVRERNRDGVLMALRAEESLGRGWLRRTRGRIYEAGGELRCIPLADWKGEDVFALIVATDTPYMHVYDRDDELPPHKIRFSWMVSPEFFHDGSVAFLKRHYPERFNHLCRIYPEARRYV